jgi:hypothetical protein
MEHLLPALYLTDIKESTTTLFKVSSLLVLCLTSRHLSRKCPRVLSHGLGCLWRRSTCTLLVCVGSIA